MGAKGWIITAACVLVMFGTVFGLRLYQRCERAAEAGRLYDAGRYEEALELYRSLKDDAGAARCEESIRDESYREAERLVRAGDYERARVLLMGLGDYRESRSLLRDCDFLRAGALAASGKAEEARSLYVSLGDYPGCKEALEALIPALYDRARELAAAFELKRACALWRDCGAYKDSVKLLQRGERALDQIADKERVPLNDSTRRFDNPSYPETYVCDEAYILFPEKPDAQTRFFLYFPGGRDEELYIEFLYYYLENPAPNTLAVFLRRNDLPDMEGCCRKGLRLLDEAAADCGVFVDKALAAGSSLGAYPALQCPRIARSFAVEMPCVLSLDAGKAWSETKLVPTAAQCRELAELGTHLYLFQPTWEDTDYEPIRLMVDSGCWVMLAGCLRSDHEQITCDALGMGVIDWALGDREDRCPGENYSFRRLKPA